MTANNAYQTPRRILSLATLVVILILAIYMSGEVFEYLPANEILVVQSPFSGTLTVYVQQGTKWQGFGSVTHYRKRSLFSFSSKKDQGGHQDESIKVQFAEGGSANVSGVGSWEMPMDNKNVIEIHTHFGNQEAVEQQLVRPAIERSLYFTGPLMTSTEAFSTRKADFLKYFEDQVRNGIYQTQSEDVRAPDPITGQEKTVKIVRITNDPTGVPARSSDSPLKQFGIVTLPFAIDNLDWEPTVKAQIAAQQSAITQVQTAQAQAKEAEQKAITIAKQGEAEAAKAKWDQEVIKAKEVTAAQQRKEVAALDAQSAALYKQTQILEGEGDAEKKRLIMSADGALEKKLATYEKVNQLWADAFAKHTGPLVPNVQMGSGGAGTNAVSGAQLFMDLLGVKAAKDMSLDLSVPSGRATTTPAAAKRGN